MAKTGVPPPYSHDLPKLARKCEVNLGQEGEEELAEISTFNISTRYDDEKFQFYKKATRDFATNWLEKGMKWYKTFFDIINKYDKE